MCRTFFPACGSGWHSGREEGREREEGRGGWSGREHGSGSHSAADLVLLHLDPRKQRRPVRSWRRPAEETLCVIFFLLRFTRLAHQTGQERLGVQPGARRKLILRCFSAVQSLPPRRGPGRSAAPCAPRRLDNRSRNLPWGN